MSNNGKNILDLFQQTRKIFEQVALLLRTQEVQMEKKNWKTDRGTAISDMSYHIKYPSWWIPIVAFRFYLNKTNPNKLAFVSVLLDNHWGDEYTIQEPLITAGFLDFGKEKADGNLDYSYARIYGYLSNKHNLEPNSESFSFDMSMLPPSFKGDFKSGKVFALPLVSIENDKDIRSKITDKLLKLVEKKEI